MDSAGDDDYYDHYSGMSDYSPETSDSEFSDSPEGSDSDLETVGSLVPRLDFQTNFEGNGTREFIVARRGDEDNLAHSLRRYRSDGKQKAAFKSIDHSLRSGKSIDREQMWVTLPYDLMNLIAHNLPYSSFCKFRSVCKTWNNCTGYLNGALTTTRSIKGEVPFCIICMQSQSDQSVSYSYNSYNPLSHSWHPLPASFSWLGFNGDILAQSCGLVVVQTQSTESGRHKYDKSISVVNLINKCKRQLPRLPSNEFKEGFYSTHFIYLDESHLSFKVIKFDAGRGYYSGNGNGNGNGNMQIYNAEIQIYDSRTDSWETSLFEGTRFQKIGVVLSVLEFDGNIYFVYKKEKFYSLFEFRMRSRNLTQATNVFERYEICSSLRRLEGGQLFVKDGNVMLGGVVIHKYRDHHKRYTAHIWKLKESDSKWHEVSRAPKAVMDELSSHYEYLSLNRRYTVLPVGALHVAVHGDYMWVTGTTPGVLVHESNLICGVMCHIPSNSWWKLPECSGSQNTPIPNSAHGVIQNGYQWKCLPFLFS